MVLATSAAFLFGCAVVISRRGLNYLDAPTGGMISIGTTAVFYLLWSPLWMRGEDWFSPGMWVFVGIGFLHPLMSQIFALEANRRMGPTLSATLCATSPFFAATTAILFLDESPTLAVVLGTLLTVVGIIVLSWDRHGVARIAKPALLFATGAAVIRGVAHTLGKFGLNLMPNPFMAGFVSFAVAFFGAVFFYRLRMGYLPRPTRMHRTGIYLFMLVGTIVGLAIWCLYGALSVGNVSVVSPTVSLLPMFALLVSVTFRQEKVTRQIVTGVCVVVAGVVMIGIGAAH